MMTDASQNIVWQASYDPFGAATINTATISNNLRFPGMYSDTETGLYYNMNRYYYPSIGRYIEPDPILQPMVNGILSSGSIFNELLSMFAINPQKLNDYLYAINNPVNFIDILGLQFLGGSNAQIGNAPSPPVCPQPYPTLPPSTPNPCPPCYKLVFNQQTFNSCMLSKIGTPEVITGLGAIVKVSEGIAAACGGPIGIGIGVGVSAIAGSGMGLLLKKECMKEATSCVKK
ncbi:MAG: hypothetical protein M1517_01195 [Deltaproteobacteria bacterium]|nr:hypothetical protein [Deltaproteobacteria bacterium]